MPFTSLWTSLRSTFWPTRMYTRCGQIPARLFQWCRVIIIPPLMRRCIYIDLQYSVYIWLFKWYTMLCKNIWYIIYIMYNEVINIVKCPGSFREQITSNAAKRIFVRIHRIQWCYWYTHSLTLTMYIRGAYVTTAVRSRRSLFPFSSPTISLRSVWPFRAVPLTAPIFSSSVSINSWLS